MKFDKLVKDACLISIDDLRIKYPSKTIVFGPTWCGKTTMILGLYDIIISMKASAKSVWYVLYTTIVCCQKC